MKTKFGLFSLLSKHSPRLLVRLLRDEAGSYIVYMTILMPVLIGVAALGSEGGWWLYTHQTLQDAADAAAYSGAVALSNGKTLAQITTQADAVAASYCTLPSKSSTCFVHNPPVVNVAVSTPTSSEVDVTITQQQTTHFSYHWLLNQTQNISARAIATLTGGDCVLALGSGNSNAITVSGGSSQLALHGVRYL